jgi:hypothetical protein
LNMTAKVFKNSERNAQEFALFFEILDDML